MTGSFDIYDNHAPHRRLGMVSGVKQVCIENTCTTLKFEFYAIVILHNVHLVPYCQDYTSENVIKSFDVQSSKLELQGQEHHEESVQELPLE